MKTFIMSVIVFLFLISCSSHNQKQYIGKYENNLVDGIAVSSKIAGTSLYLTVNQKRLNVNDECDLMEVWLESKFNSSTKRWLSIEKIYEGRTCYEKLKIKLSKETQDVRLYIKKGNHIVYDSLLIKINNGGN